MSKYVFMLFWVMGIWQLSASAQRAITAQELADWTPLGSGSHTVFQDGLLVKEAADSKGFMLLSKERFSKDFILRFSMVPLTSSAVLVLVVHAADTASGELLSVPPNYDGSMGIWTTEKQSYFVAFRNAPHASVPYIQKQPGKQVVKAQQPDDLLPGKKYKIELGSKSGLIWLKVDGKLVVQMKDAHPLPAAQFAFRVRGLPGLPAAFLLHEISVDGTK